MFERGLFRIDMAEQIGRADMQAGGAGDVQVVTGIHADDADILDRGFRAIARAAGDSELHFRRCPGAAEQPLHLDAEAHRILRAEAAPVGADAGLHRAQALGVGKARDEAGGVELRPHGRQVFLLHAEQIDALPARDLDSGNAEAIGDIGDGAQFVGRGEPAPHARHDREGAVLLDVGVNALVDETRLVVVLVVVGPGADEIIVERRTAGRAAAGGLPGELLHHRRQRLQFLRLDLRAHFLMREIDAFAHRLAVARDIFVAERGDEQRLDFRRALAAGCRRLGPGAHLVDRGQAAAGDRLDDRSLAYAVAAADFRIIRQGCNGRRRVQRGPSLIGLAENQRVAHRGDVDALLQHVEIPGPVGGIAIEDRADDLVVAQNDALVDLARGIAQHDLVVLVALGEIAGGEEIDAGDLELGRSDGAGIARALLARELAGQHLGHVVKRRDEAVAGAAMLHAFADRVDVGIARAHEIVDDDAALRLEAGILGERRIGTNADRHHHEVGGKRAAIVEQHAFDARRADDRLGVGRGHDLDAALLDRALQ